MSAADAAQSRHQWMLWTGMVVAALLGVAVTSLLSVSPGWSIVAVVMASFAYDVPASAERKRRGRAFTEREPCSPAWRERYPDCSDQEVFQFIETFADAFSTPDGYSLHPDDRLLAIYESLHPPEWSISDNLEFECLGKWMKREYRVDLSRWPLTDVTLGELFEVVRLREPNTVRWPCLVTRDPGRTFSIAVCCGLGSSAIANPQQAATLNAGRQCE